MSGGKGFEILKLAERARLSHRQRVTRVFRWTSMNIRDWNKNRVVWKEQHAVLRAIFDESAVKIKDPEEIEAFMEHWENQLEENAHPLPFIHHDAPMGTSYHRDVDPRTILGEDYDKLHPDEDAAMEEYDDWANGRGKYAAGWQPGMPEEDYMANALQRHEEYLQRREARRSRVARNKWGTPILDSVKQQQQQQ